MPLFRQSVGIYQETSSHATRLGTLGHSRLSSLSHCGLILASHHHHHVRLKVNCSNLKQNEASSTCERDQRGLIVVLHVFVTFSRAVSRRVGAAVFCSG